MKKIYGFSLVELIVVLVLLSCIIAALTPVITKKLQSQGIVVGSGGGGGGSINIDVGTDCDSFSNCALCSIEKCVLCNDGICAANEYVVQDDCSCKTCADDFGSTCSECQVGGCTKCIGGYTLENNTCTECPVGYYCNGELKQPCENGYYQDQTAQTNCKTCESKTSNCSKCDPLTGACLECKSGYTLSGGVCSNYDCGDLALGITINGEKYCMTKYNMGDNTTFALPSGITIATAGSTSCTPSESNFCCWQGTTSTSCDASNGGYSGCNRTVCDWRAANNACEKLEYMGKAWRLPTSNEWASIGNQLNDIQFNKGAEGLMLCDSTTGYSSAGCMYASRCSGSADSKCYPYVVWGTDETKTSQIDYLLHTAGNLSGPYEGGLNNAYSARCIAKADSIRPTNPCGDLAMEVTLDGKKLCMTKYNIGDGPTGGEILPLPSDSTVVSAGMESCMSYFGETNAKKCIWVGNTSDGCANQKSDYSGCRRTLGNYRAAYFGCKELNYMGLTWRLPTLTEINSLISLSGHYTENLGNNGLQLCSAYGNNNYTYCSSYYNCLGSYGNNHICQANGFWYGNDGYRAQLTDVLYDTGALDTSTAISIRCVSDL